MHYPSGTKRGKNSCTEFSAQIKSEGLGPTLSNDWLKSVGLELTFRMIGKKIMT
jgi:hypothetical protein